MSTQITLQQFDGRALVRVRLQEALVEETRELLDNQILADFDVDGNLISVEIIE